MPILAAIADRLERCYEAFHNAWGAAARRVAVWRQTRKDHRP